MSAPSSPAPPCPAATCAPADPCGPVESIQSLSSAFERPGQFVTAGFSLTSDGAGNRAWTAFIAWGPADKADDPNTMTSEAAEGKDPGEAVTALRRAALAHLR